MGVGSALDAISPKKIRDARQGKVVAEGLPSIDSFIYTEALLSEIKDPAVKRTLKTARQAMFDFISDTNTLYTQSKTPYLEQGQVKMPFTERTIVRDAASNQEKGISNKGTVNLIDASVDSMAVKTRSLGIALTTAYNISQPSTAKSFNLDTVTSTINTLLSSYEGGSVQDIQSAVASVGKLLESSFQENTQENSATTTSVFCAFDYDPVWDEIVATIEMTTFDFTLSTW